MSSKEEWTDDDMDENGKDDAKSALTNEGN